MTIKNMMTITTINDDDNTEYLKTKIKSLGDKVTDFYDNEIPKVSNHSCLVVTCLNFVLKKDESYYPQVFSKGRKCIKKNVLNN